MKLKIAIAFCVLALAILSCAAAEPGDPPGCPWEYMTYAQVVQMEEAREAQIVDGVVSSPYLLWQAYLGHASLSVRLYDVNDPIFPVQLLFRESVSHAKNDEKLITLRTRTATEKLELRVDLKALDLLQRAEIETIVLRNGEGETLSVYACEDIRTVFDFFGLAEGETLCLQGDDAPVYAYSVDGVRRALGAGN